MAKNILEVKWNTCMMDMEMDMVEMDMVDMVNMDMVDIVDTYLQKG